MIRYLEYKGFNESIRILRQRGGVFQLAAEKVQILRTDILDCKGTGKDPFKGLRATKAGESRIPHCVKYDLPGHCRLITVKDNKFCFLLHVADEPDSQNWIERNKGVTFVANGSCIELVRTSENLANPIAMSSDYSDGALFSKISGRYLTRLLPEVDSLIMSRIKTLTSTSTDEDIKILALTLPADLQTVFYDVFLYLRAGQVEKAKLRIDKHVNNVREVTQLPEEECKPLITGDELLELRDMESADLEHYLNLAEYQQWMLFLHPDQRRMVDNDFDGPAQVLGVSGSGKTCIIIKRAIRLARKYPQENILILTLNPALARLIDDLVSYAIPVNESSTRNNIRAISFWQFCKEKLIEFEPNNERLYVDETYKTNEEIEAIWREFYRCENNNDDAAILWPIHKELLGRTIFGEDYLYQEMCWIRSVIPPSERKDVYPIIPRVGRSIPFDSASRSMILKGLSAWEEKMRFVGAVDYLGLAVALFKHFDKIKEEYRCILVDEVQDFGSIELRLIRRAVAESENDLFMCGDVSQQISTKHLSLSDAGINCTNRFQIQKNYRNSQEILKAAYEMAYHFLPLDTLQNKDFEIFDPLYSSRSSSRPIVLTAYSLAEELRHCMTYLLNLLKPGEKAVVALCGFTLREVERLCCSLAPLIPKKIACLNGSTGLADADIFFSDLEQTKGFEFDTVCVLNCSEQVFPNHNLPSDEQYREIRKLYVSMTRAKTSLIMSYSDVLSPALAFPGADQWFVKGDWSDHTRSFELPEIDWGGLLRSSYVLDEESCFDLCAPALLYRKEALRLSRELIDKIEKTITGKKDFDDNGKQIEWCDLRTLAFSLNSGSKLSKRVFRKGVLRDQMMEFIRSLSS